MPLVATLHVVTEPDEKLDIWTGHCLDLDLASQGGRGRGATNAWLMLQELIEISSLEDLRDGISPMMARRRAPAEYWRWFLRVSQYGQRIPFLDALEGSRKFAALLTVAFVRSVEGDDRSAIVATQIKQSRDAFVLPGF
jgi:hypothetical protein